MPSHGRKETYLQPDVHGSRIPQAFYAAAAFVIPLATYILTAGRTVASFADSAELTTAAVNLDAAHPPGYPLFIILGKLFTLIPIGSFAFRVNLLSCTAAAATIFLIFHIVKKLGFPNLSALLASQVLAYSYSFWLYAITAEVYALNIFLFIAEIYFTLAWMQTSTSGKKQEATSSLYAMAFFFGLALANHMSILLVLPALAYAIWVTDSSAIFKQIVKLIMLAALGLTPYLFLIYAAAKPHYPLFGNLPDPHRLIAYIAREDYGGFLSAGPSNMGTLSGISDLFAFYLKLMFTRFTPLAPLLAGYFLLVSLVKQHRVLLFFSLILVMTTLFPVFALRGATAADLHSQGTIERFSVLGLTMLGLTALVGLHGLFSAKTAQSDRLFQIITTVLIAYLVFINVPNVNKADYRLTKNYALNILNQVEPDSIIFTSDDMTLFSLLYYVNAEKVKPDITLINTNYLEVIPYQKELKNHWPDLYQTDSSYSYDIARDIINYNQGKHPVYFVMLKDPYPLGFDGNPHILLPVGLLLKADVTTDSGTIRTSSLINSWGKYDLSDLTKKYKDPFAQLAQENYRFRAEVNTKIFYKAGCIPCAQNDISALSEMTSDRSDLQTALASIEPPKPETQPKSAQDFLKATQDKLTQPDPTLFYLHRAVWDLEQALALEPDNREARTLLANLMRSIGL